MLFDQLVSQGKLLSLSPSRMNFFECLCLELAFNFIGLLLLWKIRARSNSDLLILELSLHESHTYVLTMNKKHFFFLFDQFWFRREAVIAKNPWINSAADLAVISSQYTRSGLCLRFLAHAYACVPKKFDRGKLLLSISFLQQIMI